MASTLAVIETATQFNALDNDLTLTTGEGLVVANRIYRSLFASFPWAESRFRIVLNNVTVADREIYEYEYETTSTLKYSDIDMVEIESPDLDSTSYASKMWGTSAVTTDTVSDNWKRIAHAPNEYDWGLAGREDSAAIPKYYKRLNFDRHYLVAGDIGDGSTYWHDEDSTDTWTQSTDAYLGTAVRKYKATANDGTGATTTTAYSAIAFRPFPSTASQRIRITGNLEPTAFATGASTSAFISAFGDDVLARLIAAEYLFHDGVADQAQIQMQKATSTMQRLFKNEQITTESLKDVINAA